VTYGRQVAVKVLVVMKTTERSEVKNGGNGIFHCVGDHGPSKMSPFLRTLEDLLRHLFIA
jgi:hypothetical protein